MPDDGVSERVLALTQRINRSAVHVRHPRQPTLTLCGRSVDKYPLGGEQPGETTPIGCDRCRRMRLARLDRAARGAPELCWRYGGHGRTRSRTPCEQPIDGHRTWPGSDNVRHDDDVWRDDGDPADPVECPRCGAVTTLYVARWIEDWIGWDEDLHREVTLCGACREKEEKRDD